MNTLILITHIAKPRDSRCAWWQALLPDDLALCHLEERCPLKYLRRNDDLELELGTLLIDSEAEHHRKSRGYQVRIGIAKDDRVFWFQPGAKTKKYIKDKGYMALMKGSGEVAAVIRMALFLRAQPNIFDAWDDLINTVTQGDE